MKERGRKSSENKTLAVDDDEEADAAKHLDQKKKERTLPDELWVQILESVDDDSVTAFACVNKQLRRVQKRSGRRLETKLKDYERRHVTDKLDYKDFDTLSEGWCLWAMSLSTEEEEKRMRRITNAEALHGYLNLLKHSKDSELIGQKIVFDEYTCAFATAGGYLEVLMWLRDNNCPWDEFTCFKAAQGGHLEVLKYAHEKGCPWDERTCSRAAKGGHLEVLKYAHEHGCPWNKWTCSSAAQGGHLDVLKYAYEKVCPWDERTCKEAALGGHLDVLKYAHEKGCAWNEGTCRVAAQGGHLDVLKYAHEKGCAWNEETCRAAARVGNLEVLEYARAHGCPKEKDTY